MAPAVATRPPLTVKPSVWHDLFTGTATDISGQGITLGASGGTLDTNGNTVTLASAIGGSGGLSVTSTSTLLLSATNAYTGATVISAGGTLSLSDAGSIAASSGVNLSGTFDISPGTGNKTIHIVLGTVSTTGGGSRPDRAAQR